MSCLTAKRHDTIYLILFVVILGIFFFSHFTRGEEKEKVSEWTEKHQQSAKQTEASTEGGEEKK